jgi:drug/metabolite transporter (DMT)-like permease
VSARLTPRLALLLTLPPLMWAGNAVVGRAMVGHVPPLALNALRWLLAGLLLAPLARRAWRDGAAIRARFWHLLVIGTLGIGSFNALQYLALVTSTPLNVTLINASMPLWMLLVGAVGFAQHPSRGQIAGAVLSLAGVAVVLTRGTFTRLTELHFVAGDTLMLLAVLGWAVYSWLLARPPMSMRAPQRPAFAQDWAAFLFVQIAFGLIPAGGAALAEAAWTTHPPIEWSSVQVIAALAFVAVGPSLVAYRSWGLGVAEAGPALPAFFVNLSPLFAALMSATVLGERPQPFHGVAFVLIVAGIVVSILRH